MKIYKLLPMALFTAITFSSGAQSIPCSSFCVTGMNLDSTAANQMNVTIYMAGSSSNFINYPYITLITGSNGDTIATGTMNFFGQFGNSSQTYTVTTSLTSIPVNFNCTVYFTFDTVLCALAYPCTTSATVENQLANLPVIYPNPANGMLVIEGGDQEIEYREILLYNHDGRLVYSKTDLHQNTDFEINISAYPAGIYFLKLYGDGKVYPYKFIIQ